MSIKDYIVSLKTCTNNIERKFLHLRTHIKRLGRKSINKVQKDKYTDAILRIYFSSISNNGNELNLIVYNLSIRKSVSRI